jgi:hypothetical protein
MLGLVIKSYGPSTHARLEQSWNVRCLVRERNKATGPIRQLAEGFTAVRNPEYKCISLRLIVLLLLLVPLKTNRLSAAEMRCACREPLAKSRFRAGCKPWVARWTARSVTLFLDECLALLFPSDVTYRRCFDCRVSNL